MPRQIVESSPAPEAGYVCQCIVAFEGITYVKRKSLAQLVLRHQLRRPMAVAHVAWLELLFLHLY
jgi:hypothetical protein